MIARADKYQAFALLCHEHVVASSVACPADCSLNMLELRSDPCYTSMIRGLPQTFQDALAAGDCAQYLTAPPLPPPSPSPSPDGVLTYIISGEDCAASGCSPLSETDCEDAIPPASGLSFISSDYPDYPRDCFMTVSGFYWNYIGIGSCGASTACVCRCPAPPPALPTPLPPPSPSTDGAVTAAFDAAAVGAAVAAAFDAAAVGAAVAAARAAAADAAAAEVPPAVPFETQRRRRRHRRRHRRRLRRWCRPRRRRHRRRRRRRRPCRRHCVLLRQLGSPDCPAARPYHRLGRLQGGRGARPPVERVTHHRQCGVRLLHGMPRASSLPEYGPEPAGPFTMDRAAVFSTGRAAAPPPPAPPPPRRRRRCRRHSHIVSLRPAGLPGGPRPRHRLGRLQGGSRTLGLPFQGSHTIDNAGPVATSGCLEPVPLPEYGLDPAGPFTMDRAAVCSRLACRRWRRRRPPAAAASSVPTATARRTRTEAAPARNTMATATTSRSTARPAATRARD